MRDEKTIRVLTEVSKQMPFVWQIYDETTPVEGETVTIDRKALEGLYNLGWHTGYGARMMETADA